MSSYPLSNHTKKFVHLFRFVVEDRDTTDITIDCTKRRVLFCDFQLSIDVLGAWRHTYVTRQYEIPRSGSREFKSGFFYTVSTTYHMKPAL